MLRHELTLLLKFGYYQILPLTAPSVLSEPSPDIPPVSFYPSDESCEITIGDYNVSHLKYESVYPSH